MREGAGDGCEPWGGRPVPHCASLHAGYAFMARHNRYALDPHVARMERSEMREGAGDAYDHVVGGRSRIALRSMRATRLWLAIFAVFLIGRSAPIGCYRPVVDKPMDRGVWPQGGDFHVAMVNGIVMDVIDMPCIIAQVADRVFPEAALPEAESPPVSGIK